MTLNGKGYAGKCVECDGDPLWRITRRGDVATTWACEPHFTLVALELQRDHEITELVVIHSPKAREWVEIASSLEAVINEGKQRHYCGGYFTDEYLCPTCHMRTGNPLSRS